MAKARKESLGQRIRRLRQERGLTQSQIGAPQLTEGYISMVESDKRNPSPKALEHVAAKLGVDPDELKTGTPAAAEAELEMTLEDARRAVDDGRVAQANKAVRRVLREAGELSLGRVQARAHEIAGLIAERTSGPADALTHYEKALSTWEAHPTPFRAEAVASIAWCTHQQGQPRLAVHMLESYRHELEVGATPDPVALMRTHSALIDPYFACGLPEKAAEAAREAMRLETRVDNPEQIACMHLAVARTLYHESLFDDALQSLRKAHDIYLSRGWRNRAAKAQINEAIVLAKKENFDDARPKLESALEILAESPSRLDEALAHNEMAYVLRHLDDIHGALEHLEAARPLLEDGDVTETAFNERERGLCLIDSDADVAERHLLRAVDLYRIEGAAQEIATTCKALSDLYVGRGDTERAMRALRDGIAAVEERSS